MCKVQFPEHRKVRELCYKHFPLYLPLAPAMLLSSPSWGCMHCLLSSMTHWSFSSHLVKVSCYWHAVNLPYEALCGIHLKSHLADEVQSKMGTLQTNPSPRPAAFDSPLLLIPCKLSFSPVTWSIYTLDPQEENAKWEIEGNRHWEQLVTQSLAVLNNKHSESAIAGRGEEGGVEGSKKQCSQPLEKPFTFTKSTDWRGGSVSSNPQTACSDCIWAPVCFHPPYIPLFTQSYHCCL